MIILGINAYHADASAAVVVDGTLVAAVEEERFTRVKHTAGFPARAVRYCLDAAGAELKDVNHIALPRDPRARLGRKLLYALRLPGFALHRLRVAGKFSGIDHQLKVYAGAPHAFVNHDNAQRYVATAATDAWVDALDWLRSHLDA